MLWKCEYGEAKLEARISKRFRQVLDTYRKSYAATRPKRNADKTGVSKRDDETALALSYVAYRYAHLGKHAHFEQEAEWRIVVYESKPSTQYRLSKGALVPYLLTDALPIKEVWIGPSVGPNKRIAKQTTRDFLTRNGVNAEVKYWDSPFRR